VRKRWERQSYWVTQAPSTTSWSPSLPEGGLCKSAIAAGKQNVIGSFLYTDILYNSAGVFSSAGEYFCPDACSCVQNLHFRIESTGGM